MKECLKNDLKEMTQLIAVSGSEQEMVIYVKSRLEKVCDSLEVTPLGNVIARKKGYKEGPTVFLTAHMDEIGFSVQNITPDGFILFEKVGGFSDQIVPARKVWIQGRSGRLPGVFGMRPTHLSNDNALSRATYIDIGAESREEAESLGVYIGAKIVFQSDFIEMANPDIVCVKSIDNRISCAVLLNLMENLKKEEICGKVVAVFSTLEETTIAGTVSMYNYINPDFAIVLDTVPAGDVPDVNTAIELPVSLGKGPVMIVSEGLLSGSGLYTCIHPGIRKLLYRAGDETGIKLQELSLCGKYYVTEEGQAYRCGTKGIPVTTLAIPRRYSHTPSEVADINDAVQTYEILKKVVELSDTADMSFI